MRVIEIYTVKKTAAHVTVSFYDGSGPVKEFQTLINNELWKDRQEQTCILNYNLYWEEEDLFRRLIYNIHNPISVWRVLTQAEDNNTQNTFCVHWVANILYFCSVKLYPHGYFMIQKFTFLTCKVVSKLTFGRIWHSDLTKNCHIKIQCYYSYIIYNFCIKRHLDEKCMVQC